MSKVCLKGVLRVFKVYFWYIWMVFLGLQGYLKGVSRLSQACLKSVSRVRQGWLKGVSIVHYGCFKVKCNLEVILDLYRMFPKQWYLCFCNFFGKLNQFLNFGSESSSTNTEETRLITMYWQPIVLRLFWCCIDRDKSNVYKIISQYF